MTIDRSAVARAIRAAAEQSGLDSDGQVDRLVALALQRLISDAGSSVRPALPGWEGLLGQDAEPVSWERQQATIAAMLEEAGLPTMAQSFLDKEGAGEAMSSGAPGETYPEPLSVLEDPNLERDSISPSPFTERGPGGVVYPEAGTAQEAQRTAYAPDLNGASEEAYPEPTSVLDDREPPYVPPTTHDSISPSPFTERGPGGLVDSVPKSETTETAGTPSPVDLTDQPPQNKRAKIKARSPRRAKESAMVTTNERTSSRTRKAAGQPPALSDNAVVVMERRIMARDAEGNPIETPEQCFRRVARNLAEAEVKFGADEAQAKAVEDQFYALMASLDFLPNSPTLVNAGRELQQLSACFVLPVPDSIEGIFESIKHTAIIHKSGGGTGFAFSRLRPANDRVKTTMGVASGPVSFMKVFDSATEAIKQGGTRRGANMGILAVDHPDIDRFIEMKADMTTLTNFNISVGVSEKFMEAAIAGEEYELVNPNTGQVTGTKDAAAMFRQMVENAWMNGDPGLIFLDRMNNTRSNPVPKRGPIEATNPCGEQPLYSYDSCNLGSINLGNFTLPYPATVGAHGSAPASPSPSTERGPGGVVDPAPGIDWQHLGAVVDLCVRFLDNVIEQNAYPIPEIQETSHAIRRIGLGVMGWADMLIDLRIPYDSQEAISLGEEVMRFIQERADAASEALANERGSFPDWEDSIYGPNAAELPSPFGRGAGGEGLPRPMRNSTRTTIAPTGTLSIIADCSGGIEPVFSLAFTRTHYLDKNDPTKPTRLTEVNKRFLKVAEAEGFYSEALIDYLAEGGSLRDWNNSVSPSPFTPALSRVEGERGPGGVVDPIAETEPGEFDSVPSPQSSVPVPQWVADVFVTAHDITPDWHVRQQAAFQRYTDNAVSKTINFAHDATVEDVETAYLLAYREGLKGITIYRDGSRDFQVLSHTKADAATTVEQAVELLQEAAASRRGFRRKLPAERQSITHQFTVGEQKGYFTVGLYEDGTPGELFINVSKQGSTVSGLMDTLGMLTSYALQYGVDVDFLAERMKNTRFEPAGRTANPDIPLATSIVDYIFRWLEKRFGQDAPPRAQLPLIPAGTLETVQRASGSPSSAAASASARTEGPADKPALSSGKRTEGDAAVVSGVACPDCGAVLHYAEGCLICRACGYNKCG
jgi:ribonucleoside-diphosphate reductase alpha chain